MSSTVTSLHNPLASLPSLLAIRDLRSGLRHNFEGRTPTPADLAALLALDPPALLRGWRAATAPMFGPARPPANTIELVQLLGPTLARRLLDTPAIDLAGTGPIRRLWLHSVATAIAAADLAQQSGLLDPASAYLLGLLHDLPQWLQLLSHRHSGSALPQAPAAWLQHWRLPPAWVDLLVDRDRLLAADSLSKEATLLVAAETMAELADFSADQGSEATLLTQADRSALLQARELRHKVEARLRTIGLDGLVPDYGPQAAAEDSGEAGLFASPSSGSLDEVVASLLGCGRSDSYRGLITALTSAAVRYGGYDRATYVKWQQANGSLVLRSKADMSSRRMQPLALRPTNRELAALRRACQEERPVRLEAELGNAHGLLATLGCDEALVVVLNRDLVTPALLVLDRNLSLQPIQIVDDACAAATLAQLGTLLNQNLLLRRQRQRADQFATIDPLTRLGNRRYGLQQLEQELLRANRSGQPLTVLLCDLDHFKQLNDQHGHLQGDVALRATAAVMRQTLRRSDQISRFGGEEFLVVLPETSAEDATVLAARLFTATEQRGQELDLPLTISIGLTAVRPGDTAETLLHRADQALYASKGTGRNRFSVDVETGEEAQPKGC